MDNDDDNDEGVPAERNEKRYDCCPEVYIDITFTVCIRRRKLYYIFNLVVPCLMMSCLWTSLPVSSLTPHTKVDLKRPVHDVLSVAARIQHAAGRRRKNYLRFVCFSCLLVSLSLGFLSYYFRQEGYDFVTVCAFVGLRVCVQNISKCYGRILMIFSRKNASVLRNNQLAFGEDLQILSWILDRFKYFYH